jgi:hypothetical protein
MASEDIDYSTLYETQPDKYTLNYKAVIKYEDLISDTPTEPDAARLARIQTGWRPETFLDNKAYYLEKKAFIIAIVYEKVSPMGNRMGTEEYTNYIDNYGRTISFWRGIPSIDQYGTKPMTNNQIDTFLSSLASRSISSNRTYFGVRRVYNTKRGHGQSGIDNIADLIKDDDNSELEQRVNMLQTQVEQLQSQLASLAPTPPPILSNDTFPVVSNEVPSGVPSGLSNEVPSRLSNEVPSRLPNEVPSRLPNNMNGGKKTKSKSKRNKKTKKHKLINHNKKTRKN